MIQVTPVLLKTKVIFKIENREYFKITIFQYINYISQSNIYIIWKSDMCDIREKVLLYYYIYYYRPVLIMSTARVTRAGIQTRGSTTRILDTHWIQATNCWILDTEFSILDTGHWTPSIIKRCSTHHHLDQDDPVYRLFLQPDTRHQEKWTSWTKKVF